MKTFKHFLIGATYLFLGWLSIGCGHAQVTPTPQKNVDLSWTAPTNPACTTAAPCTYDVSRSTLTAGATSCPAVNYTTPNYTPLNSSNPVSTVTYTDTAAAGLTACYIVQTVQSAQVSPASNTAGPFVVPPVPGLPTISGAVAEAQEPPLPMPSSKVAPTLTAKLTSVR